MEAVRRQEIVVEDGQIRLTGLPYKRGDVVEVILLPRVRDAEARPVLTVQRLRQSGATGLWKDRAEIEDSSAFARQLRRQAERRAPLAPHT